MLTYSYSDDDELVWAALLESTDVDEERGRLCLHDYLFRPDDRFSKEFWTISAELIQLNDYCVLCLQEVRTKLKGMQKELSDLLSGHKRVSSEYGDFTGETIYLLEDELHIWQDTHDFLTRAMCLILLFSLLERSLKLLCNSLAPPNTQQPGKYTKLAKYLDFIRDTCRVPFVEPLDFYVIETQCRNARNQFAHGDWDELRATLGDISLRNVFAMVSNLFKEIEISTWKTIWSNTP